MQRRGTVKFFLDDKGYGFIRPDDGAPDIFVHRRDILPGYFLEEGDKVLFDIAASPRDGRPLAIGVTVVDAKVRA